MAKHSKAANSKPHCPQPLPEKLLSWFLTNQRPLPWRENRDVYAIWVSEIMLQQTVVAAVIPKFQKFMARFPSVSALASAEEQEVLRYWEGLGYYRRARSLHKAAQIICQEFQGAFPTDPRTVQKLPGFGRYTTNAVLSQAFDQKLPILEANSIRVLCRLFALEGNPKVAPLNAQLWHLAESLLPECHVGDFNQALMELGALVCTPTKPACMQCPLANECQAFKLGKPEQFPTPQSKPKNVEISEIAIVMRRHEQVFIVQRPHGVWWENMWEFPHRQIPESLTTDQLAKEMMVELTGFEIESTSPISDIRHGVTKHRITLKCYEANYLGGEFRSDFYQRGQWVSAEELADFPFSSPQRKLAKMVLAKAEQWLW